MEINTDDISSIEIINYSTNSYKLGRLVSLFKGLDFDIADFQVLHDGKSLKIYLGSNPKETNTSEGDE